MDFWMMRYHCIPPKPVHPHKTHKEAVAKSWYRIAHKNCCLQGSDLSALLYSCETWTTYCRHIQQLEQFHQRCPQSICNIKWRDKVSKLEVLQKCGLPSLESLIMRAQHQWAGHVVRMPDSCMPKLLLYRQLKERECGLGRPLLRYKDKLKELLLQELQH